MKLLFGILLCALPVACDLIIGRVCWKKKTVVQHVLTSGIRLAIIALLSILNPAVEFWRSALLAIAFHYSFFPVLYNRLILGVRFDYLGTTALSDRLEQDVRDIISTPGVFFFKIAFLLIAIKFYASVCIQWDCVQSGF